MKSGAVGKSMEEELWALVADKFPDVEVTVEHSARWNRPCVIFRTKHFADLLPEERFHRLAVLISESYRKARLAGFVWVELAPGDTVDSFLKLPRSEDVVPREAKVYAELSEASFFDALKQSMGPSPEKRCTGDFNTAARVLRSKKFTADRITDARLVFIRHGAYCDCQVLQAVQPALAKAYAGAA